jgi:hypothetical protein
MSKRSRQRQRGKAKAAQPMREALPSAGGIDADEDLYRRLTGNAQRDLTPVSHDRTLQIAHYLGRTNPLAKWILNTTRDFVCGEGVTVQAKDQADTRLQQVLDAFWYDPINRMPLKWPAKVRELGLFGEQCWPVFVNETTGLVRLAYVDPAMIKSVIHDPDNAEEPIGVLLRDTAARPGKKLRIIKGAPDEQLFASDAYRLRQEEFVDGDCFYYAINKNSAAETRGISDLFCLADWLDGYEQLIFNTLDRTGFINAFVWDVTINNADENAIAAWKRKNPAPKPGSLFVHNEKVIMQAVTPSLQSADSETHARIFRNHILGSAGFPEHWYGGGGDVNRATATEMDTPTLKGLQFRQLITRHIVLDLLCYQLEQAGFLGTARIDELVSINMPRMEVRDVHQAALALQQVSAAALIAEGQGWITREQAAQLFAITAQLIGADLPLDEVGQEVDQRGQVTPEYAEDEDEEDDEVAVDG